jgi:hypothetical protein
MIWGRLMTWLYPNRVQEGRAHLEAALAESGKAREHAYQTAHKVVVSATEVLENVEATRREIRSRRDQRIERERHRAGQEPGLNAAVNALKLLERRH